MGVALGIAVIAAVGLGTWAALKDEKQTQRWLEDCIAREYRISKTDYRFQHLLKGNTVCHAERDGVQVSPLGPSSDPAGPARPGGS